jgi:riboflavin synthase
MFTGIIETIGIVKQVISSGSNKIFWVESSISSLLNTDQSVSHSGVCLTVEQVKENTHRITAIDETLRKTNLGTWREGTLVNLERCLQLNDRLDGHIVQGHVDTTATCTKRKEKTGSWEFGFAFPKKFAELIIEKGSVCVNGISFTAFNVKRKKFTVAIIPFTFEHTNIKDVQEGDIVNLEFDLIGKYLLRRLSLSEGLLWRRRNN